MSPRRIGLEIELATPPGRGRLDLARRLALAAGGRAWPRLVALPLRSQSGQTVWRLRLAARVWDRQGLILADVVPDDTLTPEGLACRGDAALSLLDAGRARQAQALLGPRDLGLRGLQVLAAAWGGTLQRSRDGSDRVGLIGAAGPLAEHGRRSEESPRSAEVVSRPLEGAGEAMAFWEVLRRVALRLGCSVPPQAALHLHVDASDCLHGRAVFGLLQRSPQVRQAMGPLARPSPTSTKLGPTPAAVIAALPALRRLPPDAVRARLLALGLSKFADVNLVGLLTWAQDPVDLAPLVPGPRRSVEIRCLGPLHPADRGARARLSELVQRAQGWVEGCRQGSSA